MPAPLRVELSPSKRLLLSQLLQVGLALLALSLAGLPAYLSWPMALLLLGYLLWVCLRWRHSGHVVLTLREPECLLEEDGTPTALYWLADYHYVTLHWVVLRLAPAGVPVPVSLLWQHPGRWLHDHIVRYRAQRHIPVLPDMLDAESFRQLRVRLLLAKPPGVNYPG